jgi:hypothetical protein
MSTIIIGVIFAVSGIVTNQADLKVYTALDFHLNFVASPALVEELRQHIKTTARSPILYFDTKGSNAIKDHYESPRLVVSLWEPGGS